MAMSPPRRDARAEDSLSPVAPSSDAVLLRCRDTIERLHGDVEEERQRRGRLQEQLAQSESELIAAKVARVKGDDAAENKRLMKNELYIYIIKCIEYMFFFFFFFFFFKKKRKKHI